MVKKTTKEINDLKKHNPYAVERLYDKPKCLGRDTEQYERILSVIKGGTPAEIENVRKVGEMKLKKVEKKYQRSINKIANEALKSVTKGLNMGMRKNLKAIALLESTLCEDDLPDFKLVADIMNCEALELENLWKNKENVFRQAPNHVITRKRHMAVKGSDIMDNILDTFSVEDLKEMSAREKILLLEKLDKLTNKVASSSDTEKKLNSPRLVIDFVVPESAKKTFLDEEKEIDGDFISAEDIEFEEDEE